MTSFGLNWRTGRYSPNKKSEKCLPIPPCPGKIQSHSICKLLFLIIYDGTYLPLCGKKLLGSLFLSKKKEFLPGGLHAKTIRSRRN